MEHIRFALKMMVIRNVFCYIDCSIVQSSRVDLNIDEI